MSKESLWQTVASKRRAIGGIDSFKSDKSRCKILNGCPEVKKGSDSVVYWMQRDCRVQDNWALLFAQRLALKTELPLNVCFFAYPILDYYPTTRQYKFLLDGLKEVHTELNALDVNFYVINEKATEGLLDIITKNNVGALFCDFNPLRQHREEIKSLTEKFPDDVPFIQVDAHNVVPLVEASEKQESAARTLRPKINKLLDTHLTEYPEVVAHLHTGGELSVKSSDLDELLTVNEKLFRRSDLPEITWAKGGYKNGMEELSSFIVDRLSNYSKDRNEPSFKAQSNLSPWLHFGQISAQRCALEVKNEGKSASVDSFLEELIVRKELADNFCYYNESYDKFTGADKWARETLNMHRKDKRGWNYTAQQLESGQTHDQYWNAAQNQLRLEGKMHGYMRMYWCKKILEWTQSPEEAVAVALKLNDELSLDGSDPNGFVGVMWSVCGVHDHGWKERPVFGKIRYMVDYSLAKKFDLEPYCREYSSVPKAAKKKFKSK